VSAASALFRAPEPLDAARHGALRISPLRDFSIASRLHAVFVAATEIPEAALEYPIVFVQAGDLDADGRPAVSTVALLGLAAGENLFVEGTHWKASYLPAFVRRYPFVSSTGPMIDVAWSGLSPVAGEPLFDAQGRPSAVLDQALDFLGRFDAEARRTRAFCTRMLELDLLRPMQADATLPDGQRLTVEGFRVIDEERLRALPDAAVLELHRSGMLMLAHLHRASLARMRQLVEMKASRTPPQPTGQGDPGDGPTG
jgi:hypothetical protein